MHLEQDYTKKTKMKLIDLIEKKHLNLVGLKEKTNSLILQKKSLRSGKEFLTKTEIMVIIHYF